MVNSFDPLALVAIRFSDLGRIPKVTRQFELVVLHEHPLLRKHGDWGDKTKLELDMTVLSKSGLKRGIDANLRGQNSPQEPMVQSRRRKPKLIPETALASPATTGEYYSKAIGRALDVLEVFHDSETNLSLTDISKLGGLPESSLFRILSTLESRGYLQRTTDGAYRLAPKLLLGLIHERAERVREIARPFLKSLNSSLNETSSLAFLFEDRIQLIDTIESFHDIRITNTLGRVLPPHCSSLAKAIAAFQPKEMVDRLLRNSGLFPRTEKTIIDRGAVLADLEQVRKKGFAEDREETVTGGLCFGAPIFDERHHSVAAISVSTPMIRMSKEREQETIQAVLDAARQASVAIQGQPVSSGHDRRMK